MPTEKLSNLDEIPNSDINDQGWLIFNDENNITYKVQYVNLTERTSGGQKTTPIAIDHLIGNHETVIADCTANPLSVILPTAADSAGFIIRCKKVDASANTLTLKSLSGDLIEGSASAILSVQYTSLTLTCDGTEWWII